MDIVAGLALLLTAGAAQAQQSARFTPAGPMTSAHFAGGYASQNIAAVLLPNEDALIVGGAGDNNLAELYDPSSDRFSRAVPMNAPYGSAVVLANGNVLVLCSGVANGFDPSDNQHTSPAEIYNRSTGRFAPTGNMQIRLLSCPAVTLQDGRVLVAGGELGPDYGNGPSAAAQIYDPSSGAFSVAGKMGSARYAHTETLLSDGRVLLAGGTEYNDGFGPSLSTAEIYDPSSGAFSATGGMNAPRAYHTATLLPNGKVLIAGGEDTGPLPGNPPAVFNTAEIYDPATGVFTPTANMTAAREQHTATLLDNGQVLIAGGANSSGVLNSAEIFDPASSTFSPTASMTSARQGQAAIALSNGQVLVAGGLDSKSVKLNSAELYTPGQ